MSPGRFAMLAATAALAGLPGCASAPLSPAAARVFVYQAPLDAPPDANRLPAGCEEVVRQPLVHRSELDFALTGSPASTTRRET